MWFLKNKLLVIGLIVGFIVIVIAIIVVLIFYRKRLIMLILFPICNNPNPFEFVVWAMFFSRHDSAFKW